MATILECDVIFWMVVLCPTFVAPFEMLCGTHTMASHKMNSGMANSVWSGHMVEAVNWMINKTWVCIFGNLWYLSYLKPKNLFLNVNFNWIRHWSIDFVTFCVCWVINWTVMHYWCCSSVIFICLKTMITLSMKCACSVSTWWYELSNIQLGLLTSNTNHSPLRIFEIESVDEV